MPTWYEFIGPFASRPWRRRDVEAVTPYLNDDNYVQFSPGDPEDPRNWSRSRKWIISFCAIFLSFHGVFTSSIPSGCLESMSKTFNVSETAAALSITLFVIGYSAGPFLFAPVSEFYGRRWIIYVTFLIYMAFNILVAFAPNFGSLLVGRLFAGIFTSSSLCNTPGVLADVWSQFDREDAMAFFSFVVWAGPSLAPIVGAYLDEALGWRWSFYFVLWLGAVAIVLMTTIPETHGGIILSQKAMRIRQQRIPGHENVQAESKAKRPSLGEIYKIALSRPWALLFDYISFLCAIYLAIIFMLQYMLYSIYPIIFEEIRGWKASNAQLPLLGAIIGAILGVIVVNADTRRRKLKYVHDGSLEPEDHLPMAMVGGVGFAVSMFWFAWSGQYASVHWIIPTFAGTVLSTSLMLVFVAFVNYLIQSYSEFAASLMAVNTLARSSGSAAAPLFTTFIFDALNVGGGGSLIAGVATLLAVIPFLFYRYGYHLRINSKYTNTFLNKGQGTTDLNLTQDRSH